MKKRKVVITAETCGPVVTKLINLSSPVVGAFLDQKEIDKLIQDQTIEVEIRAR